MTISVLGQAILYVLDELMSVNKFLAPTSFIPAPNSLTPQVEIGDDLANATRTASLLLGLSSYSLPTSPPLER